MTSLKFLLTAHATGSEKRDFLEEIELMKRIAKGSNPHVVNMLGCVTLQEPLSLITEFVEHGDLLTYLCACRKQVSIKYTCLHTKEKQKRNL